MYKLPTPDGHFFIDGDRRYTLAVAYSTEEVEWLYHKVQAAIARYKDEIAGLDHLYDEDVLGDNGITTRYMYFAPAGSYQFVRK